MLDIRTNQLEKPRAVRFADDDVTLVSIGLEEGIEANTINIYDNEGDVVAVIESKEQLENFIKALIYAKDNNWLGE